MKNLLFSALMFLGVLQSAALWAQKSPEFPEYQLPVFEVEETEQDMSLGLQNGLRMEIRNVSTKDIERVWKDDMKNRDAKLKDSRGEISALGASILTVSRSKMDVYAKVVTQNDVPAIIAFFDLGGKFITSEETKTEYEQAVAFMKSFGMLMENVAIEKELDTANSDLKKMEKEGEKLVNENEKLHENIKDWEEKIRKAKIDIEKNIVDQEGNKQQVVNQNFKISWIKDKFKKLKN